MNGQVVAMKSLVRLKLLSVGIGLLLAQVALGESVSGDLAKVAVGTWLGRRAQLGAQMGSRPASVWSCQTNGASFHVVRLEGGGFVVTSADTDTEPIIAFSESSDLVASEKNPLWILLVRDLATRPKTALKAAAKAGKKSAVRSAASSKWDSLTSGAATSTDGALRSMKAATQSGAVSDVRVAPLLQTLWGQQQDSKYSDQGNPCYNYYTPGNYPCGCVATVGAQIMHYHRFPTASVTPVTRICEVETGKDEYSCYPIYTEFQYTMQGGCYDWNNMPLVPSDGTTEVQRQAIGKLTSDIGIACRMSYGEEGSEASSPFLAPVLTDVFGFANSLPVQYEEGSNCPSSVLKAALLPNLDAKLPVEVGLSGLLGGHVVVADGYGYSLSTLYVHFNMGWDGWENAWYAPPEVYEFNAIDGFVCNIYPTGTAGGVICSGRVLSSSTGDPIPGASVSANCPAGARTSCTTDDKGIYALILPAGSYTLTATMGTATATKVVTLAANVATKLTDDGRGFYPDPPAQVNNLFAQDFSLGGGSTPGGDVDIDPPPAKGATYNGVFLNGNNEVAGTYSLVVKAPKKGTKVGEGTMTLVDAGTGKKVKYTGGVDFVSGIGVTNAKGKDDFAGIHIGSKEMYGGFRSGRLIGGIDAAKAKVTDLQTAMERLNQRTFGVLFFGPENAIASFTVAVSAKGKCKIAGATPDGSKVSASAQMFVYGGEGYVPVVYSKKSARIAFLIRFDLEKRTVCDVSGLSGLTGEWGVEYGSVDSVATGTYTIRMEKEDVGECVPDHIAKTPFEIGTTFDGKKFDAGKAAKVSYKKGVLTVDTSKGDNVSGLSLKYSKGTLTGSLTVYAVTKGKLVKNKFTVSGVIVGETGYGTATNKKLGSFPVRISRD